MVRSAIVEGREYFNVYVYSLITWWVIYRIYLTQIDFTTNALDSSNQPFLQFILDRQGLAEWHLLLRLCNHLGVLRTGEEIDQIHDSFFMYISRLQDIGGREILLLGSEGCISSGLDGKMASFVLIEQSAEDGRGIKVWPGGTLVWV